MNKREFLKAGVGLGIGMGVAACSGAGGGNNAESEAAARDAARIERESRKAPPVPNRKLKTTRLFKSPQGYPNAIAASPEGLWIGEQRTDEGVGVSNDAFLVDWKTGKELRHVKTESRNTSGMGYGDGHLWMGANAPPQGIFKTNLDGKTVAHRQIPLGPADNGGGCHGVEYREGKLWINALRMKGILRVDANTFEPEFMIPYTFERTHATAWDNGAIWLVTGSLNGPSIDDDSASLAKFDAATGKLLETASFDQAEVDPHGICFHDGVLYGCDASIHPRWPDGRSPSAGYIFRIDFV